MIRSTLVRNAALALIGISAPLASAEPWYRFDWGHGRRDRDRVVVVRQPEVVVVPERRIQRVEVLPCDLRFSAYQAGDTVIVNATGTNRGGGFSTDFSRLAGDHWGSTLTLCNLSPADRCAEVITPFSVSASFHAKPGLRCLTVRAAGQSFEVPITQAPCL
jgi:hypothetical protein